LAKSRFVHHFVHHVFGLKSQASKNVSLGESSCNLDKIVYNTAGLVDGNPEIMEQKSKCFIKSVLGGSVMKRRIVAITCVVAALSITIFSIGAGAKDKAVKKQWRGCCPGCWMNPDTGTGKTDPNGGSQAMMQRCMDMMQKAGITPAMMQRCHMMMQTPIFTDSPCAIYGQGDILQLSEEQKKKLTEIEEEARKKALAVLTDEQRKKMGDIPDKPMAIAQMCQQMCSKMMPMMQNMMSGEGKTGPMIMCPMMHMTGGKGQEGSMMCPWMQ
jgi:hypothetical protein